LRQVRQYRIIRQMNSTEKTILVLGVTASGKARLAHEVARTTGGEIVSVDSMKVYRRMDIGTAKPSAAARQEVPYHLIDVVEPGESFSVGRYIELAASAMQDIRSRGKPVIVAGGTAMYIKALLYGLFDGAGTDLAIREKLSARMASEGAAVLHAELTSKDPDAGQRIHLNDTKRIIRALEVIELTGKPITSHQQQWDAPASDSENWTVIGIRRDKVDASHRINMRVKRMFDEGLVEEVRRLLAEPLPLSMQAACAIGYAEVISHLAGKVSLDDTIEAVKKNTRKLAKSQRTWFKTFRQVQWLDVTPDEQMETLLPRAMALLIASSQP
jgi:tRNA dimethylallyltransferase